MACQIEPLFPDVGSGGRFGLAAGCVGPIAAKIRVTCGLLRPQVSPTQRRKEKR
jgi:hypothetical protein